MAHHSTLIIQLTNMSDSTFRMLLEISDREPKKGISEIGRFGAEFSPWNIDAGVNAFTVPAEIDFIKKYF